MLNMRFISSLFAIPLNSVGLSQCELIVKVIGEVVNAEFWAELLRCVFSGDLLHPNVQSFF